MSVRQSVSCHGFYSTGLFRSVSLDSHFSRFEVWNFGFGSPTQLSFNITDE